jgi:hypothetical protein
MEHMEAAMHPRNRSVHASIAALKRKHETGVPVDASLSGNSSFYDEWWIAVCWLLVQALTLNTDNNKAHKFFFDLVPVVSRHTSFDTNENPPSNTGMQAVNNAVSALRAAGIAISSAVRHAEASFLHVVLDAFNWWWDLQDGNFTKPINSANHVSMKKVLNADGVAGPIEVHFHLHIYTNTFAVTLDGDDEFEFQAAHVHADMYFWQPRLLEDATSVVVDLCGSKL